MQTPIPHWCRSTCQRRGYQKAKIARKNQKASQNPSAIKAFKASDRQAIWLHQVQSVQRAKISLKTEEKKKGSQTKAGQRQRGKDDDDGQRTTMGKWRRPANDRDGQQGKINKISVTDQFKWDTSGQKQRRAALTASDDSKERWPAKNVTAK